MSRDLALRFYALQNERDIEALRLLIAPDCATGLPAVARGATAFISFVSSYIVAFPDLRHEVHETVCEGDRVAVVVRTSGRHEGPFLGHAPTLKTFAASGQDVLRFHQGRLVHRQGVFDTITMLIQLGLYA